MSEIDKDINVPNKNDSISRRAALNACKNPEDGENAYAFGDEIEKRLMTLPSAQPEREIYSKMSDKEFEKWLKDHGICNPNIRASIPCDAVPLLIDAAINERPSAQPEITRCAECIHWKHSAVRKSYCAAFDWMSKAEDFCSFAERRTDECD